MKPVKTDMPPKDECNVSPFSNGSQAMDWEAANCARCTKQWNEERNEFYCDIDWALTVARAYDGTVTQAIADRMGFEDRMPPHYCWKCPEVEWTEEWKAEVRARQEAVT